MRLIQWILSWFGRSKSSQTRSLEPHIIHLEPKYWPEVTDYMKKLSAIVKTNTIDDKNVHSVNERILNYVLDQINKKGSIQDIEQRYLALETLADRILVVELVKIVGLKQKEGSRAEFTEPTFAFKKRLTERKKSETQPYSL